MTNPYQTPGADVDNHQQTANDELASRWQRLAGAIIDTLISVAVGIPLIFALGIFDYLSRGISPPLSLTLTSGALGFLAFSLIHGHFLNKSGQTLGKKAVGIKIVGLDGEQLSLQTILIKRYLPMSAVTMIPHIGGLLSLVDALFIFGSEKRCVHDHIAGSKVVVAS